jgi:hypothetical protein
VKTAKEYLPDKWGVPRGGGVGTVELGIGMCDIEKWPQKIGQ